MNRPTCPLTLAGIALVLGATAPADLAAEPTLADLSFMAGRWTADWNGARLEEHFAEPRDGAMIGMFRWASDGATRFTEHMVIEDRPEGVTLFLRHFNPGGVIWEMEADGALEYKLVEVAPERAVFEDASRIFPRHLVYHRVKPDTMLVRLEGRTEAGEPRHWEFQFRSKGMTTTTETLTASGHSLGYAGGLTIACEVKNLDKAIDWYQDVLGFKLLYKVDEMGWCELTTSVGNATIGLSQVEKPDPRPGAPTPTFSVKDIDRARKILEGKGVRFDGDTIEFEGMVKLATFFDPDGNALMFSQSLSSEMP